MTNVGKKRCLRAIDLGERLGAFAFRLVSLRVRDRGADMACNEIKEAAVVCIDDATRTESGN